ncbi:MAG: hypothetical protein A3I05_05950 [Deltaproteobacteria bacterium RIFCSPLOWO2_02_FULL_44_10]|nr:MAG: hypothetical protein A3C46_04770 [Deltaproteobacteria bacterium RIFCSPHIGHO2_02_FULL_44_16]OGQ46146.1 MAG: hypothetical protein A3I05_05950 [Deltaproteobacteria bacterium RIFCSPLOWO2_02_FULL_44_10]
MGDVKPLLSLKQPAEVDRALLQLASVVDDQNILQEVDIQAALFVPHHPLHEKVIASFQLDSLKPLALQFEQIEKLLEKRRERAETLSSLEKHFASLKEPNLQSILQAWVDYYDEQDIPPSQLLEYVKSPSIQSHTLQGQIYGMAVYALTDVAVEKKHTESSKGNSLKDALRRGIVKVALYTPDSNTKAGETAYYDPSGDSFFFNTEVHSFQKLFPENAQFQNVVFHESEHALQDSQRSSHSYVDGEIDAYLQAEMVGFAQKGWENVKEQELIQTRDTLKHAHRQRVERLFTALSRTDTQHLTDKEIRDWFIDVADESNYALEIPLLAFYKYHRHSSYVSLREQARSAYVKYNFLVNLRMQINTIVSNPQWKRMTPHIAALLKDQFFDKNLLPLHPSQISVMQTLTNTDLIRIGKNLPESNYMSIDQSHHYYFGFAFTFLALCEADPDIAYRYLHENLFPILYGKYYDWDVPKEKTAWNGWGPS